MNPTFGVRVYKTYFNFASSHFLLFADGTREKLHGHNYQVRVRVEGKVGEGDMVLDFCRLKPIVRRCCDELDHRTLLPTGNPRLELIDDGDQIEARFQRPDGGQDRFVFPAGDVMKLPIANTSTERLAELLAGRVLDVLRGEEPNAQLTRFEIEVEESGGQCGFYGLDL